MTPFFRAVFSLLPLCASALSGPAHVHGHVHGHAQARAQDSGTRVVIDLDGPWSFQREGDEDWRVVQVPSAFEAHEGTDFDGVGVYRRRLDPPTLVEGQRAWLHVTAAATEATVSVDGVVVGHHLGGWTPFRCDVTDVLRAAARQEEAAQIVVRVDEKVGHNTQGFLPIVQPHFGGIWQGVHLIVLPETAIDDTQVLAVGDPATDQIVLEVPLTEGSDPRAVAAVGVRYRRRGEVEWSPPTLLPVAQADPLGAGLYRGRVGVTDPELWSPESPALYEVEVSLVLAQNHAVSDRVVTRAAFRSVAADGRALMLNGEPLVVRGVLDWGYAPPTLEPRFTDEEWLDVLRFTRERGFNLIKFCLWVPPKRLLELCDEEGMLAWVEYPTWHPTLDEAHRADLVTEFEEFFAHDRNHPSIVLRSLTCETGPSADLAVIADLYQLGKRMVPGALIEDDSSWIGWNRISDIWDDHPYGNNHTWSATLDKLKEHVNSHGSKPLLLGEAIAADSWLDREPFLDRIGDERPYWVPGFFDAVETYQLRMGELLGEDPSALGARLVRESIRYGQLMRKYQVETYRREVPRGGYVVSVVRDFPLASMGLRDHLGQPKSGPEAWDWHGDVMLLLGSQGDRRSVVAGTNVSMGLQAACAAAPGSIRPGLEVTFGPESLAEEHHERWLVEPEAPLELPAGSLVDLEPLVLSVPASDVPTSWRLKTVLRDQTEGESAPLATNTWRLWAVPAAMAPGDRPAMRLHDSVTEDLATSYFPGAPRLELAPSGGPTPDDGLIVARRFDPVLLDLLEAGGRVLMIPDGERGGLALSEHWFLRGAPVVSHAHPLTSGPDATIPAELLLDLQHFDLGGPVVPRLDPWLEELDPLLMLWDNHDLREVRTHGLVFETAVGEGRLLVTTLDHTAARGAAGPWLLDVFLRHLASGPRPRRALSSASLERLRQKCDARTVDLTREPWRFRTDPEDTGLTQGWAEPTFDDTAEPWEDLRVGAFWDEQGYRAYDGWAWYRTRVSVPADWEGRNIFLNIEGADDFYEVYANGRKLGSAGDLATRTTAFDRPAAHLLTQHATAGATFTLAIRIHDWQGAGGLFRPVSLSTAPLVEGADLIR